LSLIFNSHVDFDSKAITAHGFLGVSRTLKGRKKEEEKKKYNRKRKETVVKATRRS